MTQTDSASTREGYIVQANGLDIYYEEYGSGEPLVLLHGGTVTSAMWQPQIPFFAQHFRVITPDSRGHGRTDNPAGKLSYRLMADDVAAFIQTLGLTRSLICGYSDGGQIALEIGMHYPGLAGALVVGAAWYRFSETYLNALKSFGFLSADTLDLEHIQREAPEWVDELKREHTRSTDPDYWKTLLKTICAMWWEPLDYTQEDFQKITEPSLIIMGDRDGLIDLEQAVKMYRLIPNAELAVLPNRTHMTATDQLFTDTVLDFLLRHTFHDVHVTK